MDHRLLEVLCCKQHKRSRLGSVQSSTPKRFFHILSWTWRRTAWWWKLKLYEALVFLSNATVLLKSKQILFVISCQTFWCCASVDDFGITLYWTVIVKFAVINCQLAIQYINTFVLTCERFESAEYFLEKPSKFHLSAVSKILDMLMLWNCWTFADWIVISAIIGLSLIIINCRYDNIVNMNMLCFSLPCERFELSIQF